MRLEGQCLSRSFFFPFRLILFFLLVDNSAQGFA
jgi:hypothetical protein